MDYDVIVIGIGAMGSATLEQLSRRGARVLGIEQSAVPNTEGSSGGDTRLIRKAYFEHPDYVPLLERAYENWRSLEERSGERLLFPTGAVYVGPADGELIGGSFKAAREHQLPLEALSVAQITALHPQFRIPLSPSVDYVAAFEPDAGFVMSGRSISAFAASATGNGARLLSNTRVESWRASERDVVVETNAGKFRADRLVVTGGSWSTRLLGIDDLALQVTRQALFWVEPENAQRFELGNFPCWAVEHHDYGGVFYGFPGGVPAATAGVKFAHHYPGVACHPDQPIPEVADSEYAALREAVAPFIPGLDGSLYAAVTCKYTMSNDQHFIVDQHPRHSNVTFAAGFSGHGFKFASVIGELLADYALDGSSKLPGGFLRIGARDLFR